MRPALIVLLGSAIVGCSTVGTTFRESITDEAGVTTTTEYKARSTAGPLGKLDTTGHQWRYAWGGQENSIATGQDSAGIDNGQQAVVVQALQAVLSAFIQRMPNAVEPEKAHQEPDPPLNERLTAPSVTLAPYIVTPVN